MVTLAYSLCFHSRVALIFTPKVICVCVCMRACVRPSVSGVGCPCVGQ